MATKPCRDCKQEVSTAAKKCPHCGADRPALARKPISAGMGCLIILGVFVVAIAIIPGSGSNTGAPASPAVRTPPPPDPLRIYRDSVVLEIVSWQRGGFDNVMIGTFRVRNNGTRAVKDITIHCTMVAESGTEVGVVSEEVLKVFPAGKRTTLTDLNMGFINTQSQTARCRIDRFSFAG